MLRRFRRRFFHHPPVFYSFHFLLLLTGGFVGQLLAITEQFVWEPIEAFLSITALLLCNTAAKVILAHRTKKGKLKELEAGLYRMVSYQFILFLSFNLGRHEVSLFWLPSATFGPLALFQLSVLIRDLIKLKFIDSPWARAYLSKIESKYPNLTETYTDGSTERQPSPEHSPQP